MTSTDPAIPRPLFIAFLIVALVLIAGASLFFVPGFIGPHWPWPLKPFNARFLGAVYCAEMVSVLLTLLLRDASPLRLSVTQASVFTAIVTLASVIQYAQFNFSRLIVWVWFVIYILPLMVFAYCLWRYHYLRLSGGMSLPEPGRLYLLLQGIVLGVYCLALFVLPSLASGFWPWKIDAFHAQIYSAVFLTGAVGAWLLYRSANRLELITAGVTQGTLGGLAVLGLLLVDRNVHTVDWSALGTWVWVGAFAWLTISGLVIVWQGRRSL
jgi:hypothetical protein